MSGQNILSKAAMVTEMKPCQFKSGSDGYRGTCKVLEDGHRYQVSIIATRIGSKPQ